MADLWFRFFPFLIPSLHSFSHPFKTLTFNHFKHCVRKPIELEGLESRKSGNLGLMLLLNSSNKRRRVGSFSVKSKSVLSVEKEVGKDGGSGNGSGERDNDDVIVIGSGIGGLVAAMQLAARGVKVLVLEKYVSPSGSAGFYQRDGYTFDVGSSVMFGCGDKGLNLITRALAAVGCEMEMLLNSPIYLFEYHLPDNLSVRIH